MIPKTAAEMTGLVHIALLTRIYGDVTMAARRGRLTEDAIATIERRAIATLGGADQFADEFKTFQAEVAVAEAVKITRELLASVRAGRERQIRESP